MNASIVRIDGVVVHRGGPAVRKKRIPLIPRDLPVNGDWYARRKEYAEDIYTKIKLPPWLRLILNGEAELAYKDHRAYAYWLAAVMSWLGYSRDEIVMKLSRTALSALGEKLLRRHINAGYTAEQYGRGRR